jgi:ribonuclease BN (tRNA processing enzyme)
VLIHDGQYADAEYPAHVGWGHSSISDAVAFADRANVGRLILFHHDPTHDDHQLDRLAERARQAWTATGRDPQHVTLATEGTTAAL